MTNYLGGYYLIKLKPLKFGSRIDSLVYSCSDCINDNLVETWAYSWTTDNDTQIESIKSDYLISDKAISEIRKWVDEEHNEKKIGWPDLFADLETASVYRQKFFFHLTDLKLFAIYFNERETESFINEFKPKGEKEDEIGLYQLLSKKIVEKENSNERTIGYDLIGVEFGGDFHTFHCHDIAEELADKFGLKINDFGLFENCNDWTPVLDYLNDEENGCEPVPWFVVKTKLVTTE